MKEEKGGKKLLGLGILGRLYTGRFNDFYISCTSFLYHLSSCLVGLVGKVGEVD